MHVYVYSQTHTHTCARVYTRQWDCSCAEGALCWPLLRSAALSWPLLASDPALSRPTQGQNPAEAAGGRVLVSVGGTSAVLLLLLGALGLLLWRRRGCRGAAEGSRRSKLDVASVVALEELQDPELHSQLMSSLRRSRSRRDRPPSAASEPDPDGVFLMVYLPSPYEQTLTRIARAASTSSSKDLEPSPGPSPAPSPGPSPAPSPGPDSGSCRLEVLQELRD